jgi:hypothetical protein
MLSIRVNEHFDVWELFVHDSFLPHLVDPDKLAVRLNAALDMFALGSRFHYIELVSRGDHQGCWTVQWCENKNTGFAEHEAQGRFRTVDEVKAALPKELVDLIEKLNEQDVVFNE